MKMLILYAIITSALTVIHADKWDDLDRLRQSRLYESELARINGQTTSGSLLYLTGAVTGILLAIAMLGLGWLMFVNIGQSEHKADLYLSDMRQFDGQRRFNQLEYDEPRQLTYSQTKQKQYNRRLN